jgi:methylmalonyl-CoA mutase cobalamin-binding domain/chain
MDTNQTYESLRAAILEGDQAKTAELAQAIVADGTNMMEAIGEATKTIREVGDRFGEGECFLPELVLSAEAMQAFMEVINPHLEKAETGGRGGGTAVVGTVKGDIHSIGKSIVATMLKASGFEVVDLGVNVAPMDVIDAAERAGAQVIGLSSLMTTSMPYQQEVIKLLNELGQRDKFFVILGGGPVTSGYARDIGADGWAGDAAAAVRVIDQMLAPDGSPAGSSFHSQEK